MGKGWSFRKTRNDHEVNLSRAGKKKKTTDVTLHPGGICTQPVRRELAGALAGR
jgi:hypothetical protein